MLALNSIRCYPSDLDFQWKDATKASWSEFESNELKQRDRIMAANIIAKFDEILREGSRKKALVIMNYRHAFRHLKRGEGEQAANERTDNTAGYFPTDHHAVKQDRSPSLSQTQARTEDVRRRCAAVAKSAEPSGNVCLGRNRH